MAFAVQGEDNSYTPPKPPPGFDPENSDTWDLPPSARRVRQKRTQGQPVRRGRMAQPPKPKPTTTSSGGLGDPRPADDSEMARLDAVSRHHLSKHADAASLAALATSPAIPREEIPSAVSLLARDTTSVSAPLYDRTKLPSEWGGKTVYTNPSGGMMSATRYRHLFYGHDEDTLIRQTLRGMVDQANSVAVLESGRRKYRGDPRVSIPAVKHVIKMMFANMPDVMASGVSMETVIGTAIQIAGHLRAPAKLEAFRHNLEYARLQHEGSGGGNFYTYAMQAELAASHGIKFDPSDPIGYITSIDPGTAQQLQAQSSYIGLKTWIDDSGAYHHYEWDVFNQTWSERSLEELKTENRITGNVQDYDSENFSELVDAPPSSVEDVTVNVPTSTGGTYIPQEYVTSAQIKAAGFAIPGWFDTKRVGDYAAQANEIATQAQSNAIWAQENPVGTTIGGVLHAAMTPFSKGSAWLMRGEVAVLSPVAAAVSLAYDDPTAHFHQWQATMAADADRISAGDATIGSTLGDTLHENLGIPSWIGGLIGAGVDIASARALDPFFLATEGLGSLKNVSRLGMLGEERVPLGLKLARAMKIADEDSIVKSLLLRSESYEKLAARIDANLGIPMFADYANMVRDGGALRVAARGEEAIPEVAAKTHFFLDSWLSKTRSYLDGKTLAGWMVATRESGGSIWEGLNQKFRAAWGGREALPYEISHMVEATIDHMRALGRTTEQMEGVVDDLLRVSFGMKPVDGRTLRSVFVEEVDTIQNAPGQIVKYRPLGDTSLVYTLGPYERIARDILPVERQIEVGRTTSKLFDDVVEYARVMDTTAGDQARAVASDVMLNFPAGYKPAAFGVPVYSRLHTLSEAYHESAFADSRFGRWIDDVFLNRQPSPLVGFEEGRYTDNIERRLRRSRVWSDAEVAQIEEEAHRVASLSNPTREHDMIGLLERISRKTWNRLAEGIDLVPEHSNALYESFQSASDKANFDAAKRAYGVDITRAPDGSLEITAAERPQTASQLINSWYVPDPAEMRKVLNEGVEIEGRLKVWGAKAAEHAYKAIEPTTAELEGSVERIAFQSRLDRVGSQLNWAPSKRRWASRFWDHLASIAVSERPDLYGTVDDFFKSFDVRFAKSEAELGGAPALFSTGFYEQAYTDVRRVRVTMEDGTSFVDEVKGLNPGHTLYRARENWPEATKVEDLGPGTGGFAPPSSAAEAADVSGLVRTMPDAEPGYLYHTTELDNARQIQMEGLKTRLSTWPDGATEERIYFADTPNGTLHLADSGDKGVLLRVKDRPVYGTEGYRADMKQYRFSNMDIRPEDVEYFGADGAWHSMSDQDSYLWDQLAGGQKMGAFVGNEIGGVVHLFEGADISTFVHESGHVIRSILPADDLAALAEHYGLEGWVNAENGEARLMLRPEGPGPYRTGAELTAYNDRLRGAEESFAKDLQTYFEKGIAPIEVEGTFRYLWRVFKRVWEDFKKTAGADDRVAPEVRNVLDKWFPPERVSAMGPADISPFRSLDELDSGAWRDLLRHTAEKSTQSYLRFWKAAMVLRPGYVFRVPGFDEQIRMLTDVGLWDRIRSQGIFGKLTGSSLDRVEEIPLGNGETFQLKRVAPGSLPDEAYANSNVGLNQIYLSFSDEVNQITKGANKYHWDILQETDKGYTQAWHTALNGQLPTDEFGRVALQGVAEGLSPEEIATRLEHYATHDPYGKVAAKRMGLAEEDIHDWADNLSNTVYHYTAGSPDIADAALHKRANVHMLDETTRRYTEKGAAWDAGHRSLPEPRDITILDDENLDELVKRLHPYLETNGGATIDAKTGKFLEGGDGWAVGMKPETSVTSETWAGSDAELRSALERFREKELGTLQEYEGANIGLWVDKEGKLHIDPSELAPDAETAQGLAIMRDQESVYHMGSGRVMPTIQKPTVHGLTVDALTGKGVRVSDAFVNVASKAILQYPTNRLSRQPFFKAWFDRAMDYQMDMFRASGAVPRTADEASRMVAGFEANARAFALERVNKVMFDLRNQSRLAELMGFVSPFMQPWQEAFSVYGHLLRTHPELAAWANLTFREMVQHGVVKRDQNTGEYTVPMSGFLAMGPVAGAIAQIPGLRLIAPLASFNLFFANAFPVPVGHGTVNVPVPSLSPPLTWALQQIKGNDSSRLSTWLYQFGGESAIDILPVPTYLRDALIAKYPSTFGGDGYKSYVEEMLMYQQYSGMTFPTREAAIAAAESMAKKVYWAKAFTAFIGAASPRYVFPDEALKQEWRDLQEQYHDQPSEALRVFLEAHPDQWMIAASKSVWDRVDPGLPEGQYTPSIPATQAADEILNLPGIKEFAAQYPGIAWALLPQSVYNDPAFSPDVFQKQLAVADRKYLEPEDFYKNAESSAGWNAYWHLREWWDSTQEYLTSTGVSDTDPEYAHYHDMFTSSLEDVKNTYPSFRDQFGTTGTEGLDPRVLAYTRELVKSDVFLTFPVGKATRDYLELRDKVYGEMQNAHIGDITSEAAITSGLAKEYSDGVAAITAQYPDFARMYDVFFGDKDLKQIGYVDPTTGWTEEERTAAFDWQRRRNALEDRIALAEDDNTRQALYEKVDQLVNKAYTQYPSDRNPAVVWFQNQGYSDQQEIQDRVYLKPYAFLDRFDREQILGETSSASAEESWQFIAEQRRSISLAENTIPNFDVGGAYDTLNLYIAQHAAEDPVFAQQLTEANTWGFTFFTNSDYMTQQGPAAEAWAKWKTAVESQQSFIELSGLHGTGSTKVPYQTMKTGLRADLAQLREQYPGFAAQWDYLEKADPSGNLIDYFMPDIWYRLGAVGS